MGTNELDLHTAQQPGHTITIHDELPYLGSILFELMPVAESPNEQERLEEVVKVFRNAVGHYQEPYFAYLRVRTDRAREIVGIPYYVDVSGREVKIEATGWEGYFVGCRNPDGFELNTTDIVKAIAKQGLDLYRSIRKIGRAYYHARKMPTTSSMLKVARGERFDDLEALEEVNLLYGAMLGRLRAYVYQNRFVEMREEEFQNAIESYLRRGSIDVTSDDIFERDLKKHADFRRQTLGSLAGVRNITFQFTDKTIVTTCILPKPPEKSPDGTDFKRYEVSLTQEEKVGYELAHKIGLLGNPVLRATLSLLG